MTTIDLPQTSAVVEQTDEYWVAKIRNAFPDWKTNGPVSITEVQTLLGSGRSRAVRLRQVAFELTDQTMAVRTRSVRTTQTETVEQTELVSVSDQTEMQTGPVVEQTEKQARPAPVRQTRPAVTSNNTQTRPAEQTSRLENVMQTVVLLIVGGMAGAASFTHMHDWTMANSPAGTPDWFGWGNAIISELGPLAFGLEIRRRRRSGQPVVLPASLLVAFAGLSLAAQVAQAKSGLSGWLLAAVPALAFLALVKLALSRTPVRKTA